MEDHRDNLGTWEREIAVFWANLKAAIYCLRNPFEYQVGFEYIHVEERGVYNRRGETMYREHVTWVGVIGLDERHRRYPVKTFFGKSRFIT